MRKTVFQKHIANPILTPDDFPAEVMYVLNPGAIRFKDEYILICDAALGSTKIVPWIARSKDGINFTPDPQPVVWPEDDEKEFIAYDYRITEIDGEYIIMYAAHYGKGNDPGIGVVKTSDFINFERIKQTPTPHPNRNAVLFPRKINGKYVRFDRPMPNGEVGSAGMCISYSEDLSNWTESKDLMFPRSGCWDSHKIGGAAIPLETDEGWLVLYHGVDNTSCNNYIYRLGIMLLDKENPEKILCRSTMPVLWPDKIYEFIGRTPNVVFSCNMLCDENGHLRIYYGAADAVIALAEGSLDELLAFCKKYVE